MKAFIVYPTYRIIDNKSYVYLFGRLENGESFLTINQFKPYFFIKQEELNKAKKIQELEHKNVDLKTFNQEPVAKIIFDNPREMSDTRSKLLEEDIDCFEADVKFVYRYMMDMDIKGSMNIEGDFKKGEFVNRIYEEPKLSPVDWFPNLKTFSFDIETDMKGKYIYSISMVCNDYEEVLIVSDQELKNAISFQNEKAMLEYFREKIIELDPDIITGWNVIDFDFVKIKEKFDQYQIPFKFGRTDWDVKIKIEDSFFRDSKADVPGRMVLDGIMLMKISFVRLTDYKLDTAATELLGEKKIIGQDNKGEEIEEAYRSNQQKLVDYNLKDSKLVLSILEKTGVDKLTIQRSLLTGMSLDKVKASIASFDSLYLRDLRKIGYVAPSARFGDREERIKGGYVMSSKPGIYDYVIVCDFKSLYPSIIRTFNIDPFTYVPDCKGDVIKAPNGACFRKEKGLLSAMLERLWAARDERKKANDKTGSNAIKVLMNSMFGVLANPVFRFHSIDIGNAITYFGQHLIKLTADKVTQMGFEVIYGDTDSIFIDLKVDNYEDAQKLGNQIEKDMNEFMNAHINETYGINSFLELEYEKTYKRFLMPKVRGSETGSKKRYAGLLIKGDKEEMDFVGLEFVRRDWTDLAKKFQLEMYEMIFQKKDPSEYVRKFVKDLKAGKLDDLLIYRKALRKNIEDYTKTTPPHVKAAKLLDKITSNIIEYYMTVNGPEPVQNCKSSIDYEQYIEKQIKPIANQILSFYDTNFNDVIKNSSQQTLFGY